MSNSENIFVQQDQQRNDHAIQWGYSDIPGNSSRSLIRVMAEQRISKENIIDEAEQRKVYDETKLQYIAWLDSKRATINEEFDALLGTDNAVSSSSSLQQSRAGEEQSEISLLREEVMQLKEEAKGIDERLRKLERYGEE